MHDDKIGGSINDRVFSTVILSNKHRFIYAAFYKTGSSSIEEALDVHRGRFTHYMLERKYRKVFPSEVEVFKHIKPAIMQSLVGDEKWSNYTTFVFVRNPWDRIVSLYHYHNQRIPEIFPEAQRSFDEWVKMGGTGSAQQLMSKFISDDNGKVMVDRIGRFETLEQDFKVICKDLGIVCDLPHFNKTERKNYRDYYTDETREVVRSWVQPDIEMFGYEF